VSEGGQGVVQVQHYAEASSAGSRVSGARDCACLAGSVPCSWY
jgi:hypothetical protein